LNKRTLIAVLQENTRNAFGRALDYGGKQRSLLRKEAFRVSRNIAEKKVERKRKLVNRKRRIQYRLRDIKWGPQDQPMFTASNIHYELADRVRGLASGGIGAIHLPAKKTGLIDQIDRRCIC